MAEWDFNGFDRVWRRVLEGGGGAPLRPMPPPPGPPPRPMPPPPGPPPEEPSRALRLLEELTGLYARLRQRLPGALALQRSAEEDLRRLSGLEYLRRGPWPRPGRPGPKRDSAPGPLLRQAYAGETSLAETLGRMALSERDPEAAALFRGLRQRALDRRRRVVALTRDLTPSAWSR